MKCTVLLDTDARNVVGHLERNGGVTMNEDNFSLWVKPYYHTDKMCSKCFFVPVCQGACCPLPRIQTGDRPCPEDKVEIQQTLKDIYRVQKTKQAARSVVLKD